MTKMDQTSKSANALDKLNFAIGYIDNQRDLSISALINGIYMHPATYLAITQCNQSRLRYPSFSRKS